MRTTSEELTAFYRTRLGRVAMATLVQKMRDGWGDLKGQRVGSFGFGAEILTAFPDAERVIDLVPAAAGAMTLANEVLVEEEAWPLRDASLDRLVVFHGLEEAPNPGRLLREAWRVLTDDGRLIIIAANRHGFWTLVENSPLAAGRAWSQRQLMLLLNQSLFAPTARASALYFPPVKQLCRVAPLWERTAAQLEPLGIPLPNVAGVVMVEARRSLAAPASGSKAEVLGPVFAKGGRRVAGLAAERDHPPD